MIISSYSNIDIIQGVIGYGDAEGITDWRIVNTSNGIFNILNSADQNAKLTILENGNVGIGTINPVSVLDINGNINTTGNYMKNSRDVINDTSNYVLATSNILVNRITSLPATGGSSQWTTGANNFIYYNTSNVGIGATNPSSKLHVYDDVYGTTKLIVQNNNAAALIPSLNISSSPVAPLSGNIGNDRYYIYTSGTYTLTIPTGGAICDIFMIGGGGGAGNNCGGGGGAGACIVAIGQTINAGSYTISVGSGGAGGISNNANGTNGGDSSIGSLYVAKGGGAGSGGANTATSGGCGGGACGGNGAFSGIIAPSSLNVVNGTTNVAPTTTTTYAVLGTSGGNAQTLKGGGGGGSGANGTNATTGLAGPGGNGVYQVVINSFTYNLRTYFTNNGTFGVQDGTTGNYFIGGGGGAGGYNLGTSVAGGKGGGGNGSDGNGTNGVAATANTGGGGGSGGGNYGQGGSGGSGLVIIRQRILTSSTASIELIRGVSSDSNVDYKIGNYGGDFKIISSSSNIDTEYVRITSAGAISNPSGTTSWTTTSDRRIKENIEDASYDKCYDNINNLGLYRFNYIEGINNVNKDIKQLGFIAQEVKEIFPKSVFLNNNYNIPDLLTIDITQINYTLYGAVKKLIELNEDNEARIRRVETLLNLEPLQIDTSNLSIDTSNISIDTSNLSIDTSNLPIDTSNISIDTSNISIDTSNI